MKDGKRTIMIVDDETDFTFFVKANLERSGDWRVIEINDGRMALRKARKLSPDLILLDVAMPGWDGFETLEALKRDPATTSIPVIMVSAHADQDSRRKAAGLYNEDYISKPVDMDILRESITRVLSRKPFDPGVGA